MTKGTRRKILIVGAGEAARMVAAELSAHREIGADVIGFLDDNPRLAKRKILGLPVLGRTVELERVAARRTVDEVILAIPSATGYFVRCMIKHCRKAGLPFKIVPGVMEIIKGDVRIEQIRDVRIEDLMGRESVDLDLESAREALAGKVVLVTGAGGSIGSELCRQIARAGPRLLVLLGRGENRIFDIEDELRSSFPRLDLKSYITSATPTGRGASSTNARLKSSTTPPRTSTSIIWNAIRRRRSSTTSRGASTSYGPPRHAASLASYSFRPTRRPVPAALWARQSASSSCIYAPGSARGPHAAL
jgi:hypothetical protein